MLSALPEQPGLRMIFVDGKMTLLSLPSWHDFLAVTCGDLVRAIANGLGITWQVVGHTTFRLEDRNAGVEGDDAFDLGENAERMIGQHAVDLSTQPPPDLAIEVEATHPADDAVIAWGAYRNPGDLAAGREGMDLDNSASTGRRKPRRLHPEQGVCNPGSE